MMEESRGGVRERNKDGEAEGGTRRSQKESEGGTGWRMQEAKPDGEETKPELLKEPERR